MPYRSTSRIIAALFGAFVCSAVLAAPAAFADGIDTPNAVTSLPFRINGARIMTMTSSGLGIGTTSPMAVLNVDGSLYPGIELSVSGTQYATLGAATQTGAYSSVAATGDAVLRANDGNLILAARNATGGITFTTGTPDSAKMTILSGGNVGIGETNPQAKLDILAAGSYTSPVIQLRQSNALAYGINMGIDNAFDGGLVFSAENNGTATPVMEIGRSPGYLGVVIGQGDVESQLPPNNGLLVQGNVGVGMSPVATLDVNGGIRGNSSGTVAGDACSPEGMLAYDMTNHQPVYCSSSGKWSASFMPGFTSRTYHLVNNNPANNYYSVPWTNPYSYPAEAIAICQYNSGSAVMTTYITGSSGAITDLCSTNSGSASGCNTTLTVPPGATVQVYYGLCNAAGSLYVLY